MTSNWLAVQYNTIQYNTMQCNAMKKYRLEVITNQCSAFDLFLKNLGIISRDRSVFFFSLDKYFTSTSACVSAPGDELHSKLY